MIKPEELRIGNYILGIIEYDDDHFEESICRVISLDKIPISEYHIWVESYSGIDSPEYYDYFIGIPLTEQWLLDFGFEKDEYQDNYEKIGFDIRIYDGEFLYCAISEYFPAYSISITYVHQLQNLYFALTGEDLKRKEVGNV